MSYMKLNTIKNNAGTKSFQVDDVANAMSTPFSHRNKIINGSMEIWQRGESSALTGYYTADRWYLNQDSETSTISSNRGSANSLWQGATMMNIAAASVVRASRNIQQRIENVNLFKNKDMTLSFTHNASVGQDIVVKFRQHDSSGTSIWDSGNIPMATGDGTIKRDFVTVTLPDIVTKQTEHTSYLVVLIYPQTTSTSSLNMANVQFEEGSSATPFEVRPIGYELSLCYRYYQTHDIYRRFSNTSTITRHSMELHFYTEMRAVPTLVVNNLTGMDISGNADVANTYTVPMLTTKGLQNILLGTASYGIVCDVELDAEL